MSCIQKCFKTSNFLRIPTPGIWDFVGSQASRLNRGGPGWNYFPFFFNSSFPSPLPGLHPNSFLWSSFYAPKTIPADPGGSDCLSEVMDHFSETVSSSVPGGKKWMDGTRPCPVHQHHHHHHHPQMGKIENVNSSFPEIISSVILSRFPFHPIFPSGQGVLCVSVSLPISLHPSEEDLNSSPVHHFFFLLRIFIPSSPQGMVPDACGSSSLIPWTCVFA